mgnify:CR=1 FL=1
MKIDFDTENIRENNIKLLDCQVDLILRSLELNLYIYKFIYSRNDSQLSNEEELRKNLVLSTYKQISEEFIESKSNNPIDFRKAIC